MSRRRRAVSCARAPRHGRPRRPSPSSHAHRDARRPRGTLRRSGHRRRHRRRSISAPPSSATPIGGYRGGHVYAPHVEPESAVRSRRRSRQLEGGASAIAYSSGLAATHAVFQALAPGDHVVAPEDAYYGTLRQLRELFAPWGLEADACDMTDLDAVARRDPPQHEGALDRDALQSHCSASSTSQRSRSWRTVWARDASWTTRGPRRCCSGLWSLAPTS